MLAPPRLAALLAALLLALPTAFSAPSAQESPQPRVDLEELKKAGFEEIRRLGAAGPP